MDRKFRVGIVGCGNIFPMHAYPAQAQKNAELVAICDIKEERAKTWAAKMGCGYYLNYQEMVEKEHLDVLHCCTPHYLHPIITIYALEQGLHVLTEKPMSIQYADSVAMCEAADKSGRTLGVIFQNRYNPGSQLAKEILDSGRLGAVLGARASVTWMRTDEYYSKSDWKGTWDKEGGGVIIDQAIHTLDLMRWLIGSEVDYVDAHICNRTHQLIEVEDEADGVIHFKNGVMASFYTMNYYSCDADVEIELHCEHGFIRVCSDRCVVTTDDGHQYIADRAPGDCFGYGDVKGYWGVSHIRQISAFYDSLERGERPFLDGREALKTMQMICAIYDSGKSGKRVYLHP